MNNTQISNFWKKVDKNGPMSKLGTNCWQWMATKLPKGYGQSQFGTAHRVSWKLHFGEITRNEWVLHHCDNPSCVRPEHLFLGDSLTNVRDMFNKERNSKGEKHWTNFKKERIATGEKHGSKTNPESFSGGWKLSQETVNLIRSEYSTGLATYKNLAKKYGVSKTCIGSIVHFKIWKDKNEE